MKSTCASTGYKEDMNLNLKTSKKASSFNMMYYIILLLSIFKPSSCLHINRNGGYEDIVVSITSDVPHRRCEHILNELKSIFSRASGLLHEVTEARVRFSKVVVVLPSGWSTGCGLYRYSVLPVSRSKIHNAAFEVSDAHPIFGHQPWTQQSKGCGQSGDKIHVGYDYIVSKNRTDDDGVRTFVHEWIKYRYGVFEEIGFPDDPIYPRNYFSQRSTERRHFKGNEPTSCTNKPLQGEWVGDCLMDSGRMENCEFLPFKFENNEVTSSFMSYPTLPKVNALCDSRTHNSEAPTKHNAMCGLRSVSDVMYRHEDFSKSSLRSGHFTKEPTFVLAQLSKPKFVLMIEDTENKKVRDVWTYLKLAIRKFIKYDLPTGTEIGLLTVKSKAEVLAKMTKLDDSQRGILADKLPNYPDGIGTTVSLREGITEAINMLKRNGKPAAGSVIILISGSSYQPNDLETSESLVKNENVSVAAIQYPFDVDNKVSLLSNATNSPYFSIRETWVGKKSHISMYIQLINALRETQRYFTQGIADKWPTLIHQEEFKGEAKSVVKSSFSLDASETPGEFHIYVPNANDPRVVKVELTSPSGEKYSNIVSDLYDINAIKIGAKIDKPGDWKYEIDRLGDSHQSHFVQVVTQTTESSANNEFSVRIFSNVEGTRTVDLSREALIMYAEVKKGNSPVLGADVNAYITDGKIPWETKLLDSGNGDPDVTKGDGIYSRYMVPPSTIRSTVVTLNVTVQVKTSPDGSTYYDSRAAHKQENKIRCCGSRIAGPPGALKRMQYNQRVTSSYLIEISNIPKKDVYKPSRIGDLQVLEVNGRVIRFGFTAPGQDFDQGEGVRKYRLVQESPYRREDDFIVNSFVLPGTAANITKEVEDYGLYQFSIIAMDYNELKSSRSNTVQAFIVGPDDGGVAKGGDATSSGSHEKASGFKIALLIMVVGGSLILLLMIILIVCYFSRRSRKGLGSTDTKISTISDIKGPIHWSASQLLNEHEKRQSIYVQSSQNSNYNLNSENQMQESHYSEGYNVSPGSSTRSCHSSEKDPKTSLDYETYPSERERQEREVYNKPMDVHHGATYSFTGQPPPRNTRPHFPMISTVNGSHMQYNPNVQGSLTSVTSKKRNITMV